MGLRFVYPWVLYLLWVVPALGLGWIALYRSRMRALRAFLSDPMRAKLCPPHSEGWFYWQAGLALAGCLLLLIAAARPQWGFREETVNRRGRDLIVALDVSRSMLARDAHPNRLQRAKADILDLIRELRGDRAALIAFRGKAVQLCPLTTDYAYLQQILESLTVDSAPRGETDIGDALSKALDAFEHDEQAHKVMILISDGEDLVGNARTAAEQARKAGMTIFTVGLGDPSGAAVPSSVKEGTAMTYQGKEVMSKLDHETLKSIADITGGVYVPVGVANVRLGNLYRDHLRKIAARDLEESIQRRYIERFQVFLLSGLLALFGAGLLSRGRMSGGIQKKSLLAGLIILCMACPLRASDTNGFTGASAVSNGLGSVSSPGAHAATNTVLPEASGRPAAGTAVPPSVSVPRGREGARVAQRLYLKGKYQESAEAYLQAARGTDLIVQNRFLFNAACSLYKAGQYKEAADQLSELIQRDKIDMSAAQYNLGCSLYQSVQAVSKTSTNAADLAMQKPVVLEKAGKAFQQALRASSEADAARRNLAVVVKQLPDARQEARLAELMSQYGQMPPGQITDQILQTQRQIIAKIPDIVTNASPSRITQFESVSEQQRKNGDVLIPLKVVMSRSGSKEGAPQKGQAPVSAQVEQVIDQLAGLMRESTDQLRDLDERAYGSAQNAEAGVYGLWKELAGYPQLLREDLFRQTNSIAMTTSVMDQATADMRKAIDYQQKEAGDLTRRFMERFSKEVPPEGLKPNTAASVTNATNATPPAGPETSELGVSAETRATILKLAESALGAQEHALKYIVNDELETSLDEQQQAYDLLKEIEKLLPKDKQDQQQNQSDKQDQQQQDQQQDQKDQQNQSSQQNQPKDQPQQKPPQDQPQESQQQEAKQNQSQPSAKPSKDEMTPEQAKALLEKARQREKDHESDLRDLDRYVPPSSVGRDW